MPRIEVSYPGLSGPIEEGKSHSSIFYEVDEKQPIPTPIGDFRGSEQKDMLLVSWYLDNVAVNRPDGENALETGNGNFVDLRLKGNREVIVSRLGLSTYVNLKLHEDAEGTLVGASQVPPSPQLSGSVELEIPNSFKNA